MDYVPRVPSSLRFSIDDMEHATDCETSARPGDEDDLGIFGRSDPTYSMINISTATRASSSDTDLEEDGDNGDDDDDDDSDFGHDDDSEIYTAAEDVSDFQEYYFHRMSYTRFE